MQKRGLPLKLGVTGGIGSGKTSVCKVFIILGVPVFSSDQAAKDIMDTDEKVKEDLNLIAGKNLFISGKLDRKALADIIFNNPEKLGKVNALVHPAVFRSFDQWAGQQQVPYVIMEAAILFESRATNLVDRIATVIAPVNERIERVIKRNNLTHEQVLERIRNQVKDDERTRHSHYIIRNSEKDMIIPAILDIHNDMLKYSKEILNG